MIEHKELGTPVRYTKFIKKVEANGSKRWAQFDELGQGILTGFRTVQQGSVEYDDGYRYFVPSEYIRVALIHQSLNRNPVYVPVEFAYNVGAEPEFKIKSGNHLSLAYYNG